MSDTRGACDGCGDEFPGDWFADARCYRCGVCCGATDGHPCEHLKFDGRRHFCEIYPSRLGNHMTTTGRPFRCVEIVEIVRRTGGYPGCAYAWRRGGS